MSGTIRSALLLLVLALCFPAVAAAYGNVTPSEAYQLVASDANAYILDVRTIAEWQWVGHPGVNKLGEGSEIDGKVANISYQIDKKGSLIVNNSFLTEVQELFEPNSDVLLIIMCRSGKRSLAAADILEAAGYNVLNMVTGFEGSSDSRGYRTVNGWVNDGLPYTYSGAGYQD